ncbi:hypothetical protein Tco_1233863, partial [Tanacetum coccineum]
GLESVSIRRIQGVGYGILELCPSWSLVNAGTDTFSHRFYSPRSSPNEPLILHCSSREKAKTSNCPRGIFLNQSIYVLEIIKKYCMETNEMDTPMVEKSKLDADPQRKEVNPTRYRGSTSGSMQLLVDRLVSCSLKKQKSTVISSTEAEYIALSGCCAQIL